MTPGLDFAAARVGLPWIPGADGPDAFDCWGLVRDYYRVVRGIDLPAIEVAAAGPLATTRAFAQHPERTRWVELAAARDGCAVLMSHAMRPNHVGLIIADSVLHAIRGAGVVFQAALGLRLAGWRILGYFDRLP